MSYRQPGKIYRHPAWYDTVNCCSSDFDKTDNVITKVEIAAELVIYHVARLHGM